MAAFSERSVTDGGTSLNTLERQPGGNWLIRVSSLNADEPATWPGHIALVTDSELVIDGGLVAGWN